MREDHDLRGGGERGGGERGGGGIIQRRNHDDDFIIPENNTYLEPDQHVFERYGMDGWMGYGI